MHSDRFAKIFCERGAPVPLDEALAVLSSCADPTVNPENVLHSFDQLAESLQAVTAEELMKELFGIAGFVGNTVEYDDPANSFIDKVMSRRLGIPITLCAIAIETGRRKGIDIVGIGMPGHFLCRSSDQQSQQFYDPFHSSSSLTAQECRGLYESLTQMSNWSAEFLEPTDSRLMMIRILNNLKSTYRRRGDIANLRWVMRLRAHIPEISANESTEFAKLVRRSN